MLKQSKRKERGREEEGERQEKGEEEKGRREREHFCSEILKTKYFCKRFVSSHHSLGGQSSDLPKFYPSTPNISYTNRARNAEGADQKNKALIIIIGLH